MFVSIFLNFLIIIFPYLCYLIYIIYCKVKSKKEQFLLFDVCLLTSFYLFTKCGNVDKYSIMLVNIPMFLSIYKKRYLSFLFLSILFSMFNYKLTDLNYLYFLFEYIFILFFTCLTKKDAKKIYIIFDFVFKLFILVFFVPINFNYYIFIEEFFLYVSFILICISLDKLENMIDLYNSLEDSFREKRLYESLFKITHEIKNPLAVCKGYLDMFDIKNENKSKRYISIINEEINRTLEILKDFSDLSKCTNINLSRVDINLLIDDVCQDVKIFFDNNKKFKYKILNTEDYILADYNKLKQVFINLIKNASEAIHEKGIVLLDIKKINNYVVINIIDNGCGMDKKTLNKIGTVFYTTKENGTGLGVSFSKEIINKHNGKIKYFSKKDSGTKVEIKLPLIIN